MWLFKFHSRVFQIRPGQIHRISSTLDLIFALPLEGSARIVLHSRHRTFVEAFPNMTWDVLHLEQFTFMNFPLVFIELGNDFGF